MRSTAYLQADGVAGEIFCTRPDISEVAVIGLPGYRWIEVVTAFVVAKEGANPTSEQILAHCRASLASFKAPKPVFFTDNLPRSASGKILERALRRQGVEALQA